MKSEKQLTFQEMRPDVEQRRTHIKENRHLLSLVLDGVTDPRNLGGIFRLADAALIERIYLFRCPEFKITPKIKRISRSATETVPFTIVKNIAEIEALQKERTLIALEYTDRSVSYTQIKFEKNPVLVIGNEQTGVSQELLDLCAQSMHIPMHGFNTSMNVMCATAVGVYGLLEKMSAE